MELQNPFCSELWTHTNLVTRKASFSQILFYSPKSLKLICANSQRVEDYMKGGKGPGQCWSTAAEHEPVVCQGGQEGQEQVANMTREVITCLYLTLVRLHLKSCSVLGPSVQERQWGAGVCQKKGNNASEGSREQLSWEGASTTRWKEVAVRWVLLSSPK